MPSQEPQTRTSATSQTPLIAYFLVVAALWVSSFFPEARLWGLNWYQYYGWYGRTLLLLIALAAPWLISVLSGSTDNALPKRTAVAGFRWPPLITVALFALSFILLAGRTHFLGDGYQVLGKVQAGAEVIKPWDNAIWAVQTSLYRLLGGSGEADARLALRVVSMGSGLAALLAAFMTGQRLFNDNRARMFFVLSLATGGYMLLFYGYIENYPLFALSVMLFGLIGLMVARSGWPPWLVLIPLAAALILHPFGVSLMPAAVYLLVRRSRPGRWIGGRSTGIKWTSVLVTTGMVLVGLSVFWQQSLFFRFSLVPPVADRFTVEGYTLFSANHILDYANLVLMLAPGLPLVVALLIRPTSRSVFRRPEFRFLGLLAVAGLVVIFVVNPRLGMPRDWDLFAFAGIPVVLTGTLLVLERWDDREHRTGGWLMVVVGLLVLGPRVVSQAVPEVSIAVFDHFADLDVTKSRNGRFLLQQYLERQGRTSEYARRARINAVALPHERLSAEARRLGDQGHLAEAVVKFRQAIAYDPSYHYAWANLGVIHHWQEQYDSALACLHIADGLNPYSFSINMKLAGTYSGAGDDSRAEAHWREAARLQPEDLECRTYLLRLYRQQARWTELDALVSEVIARDSLSPEIVEPVVRRQLERGDTAAAANSFRQAMKLGLDTTLIIEMQQEFPQLPAIDPGETSKSDSTGR